MLSEREVNRRTYQDTAFEAIPHILLGTRVRDRETHAYLEGITASDGHRVAELGNSAYGRLVRFTPEQQEEIRELEPKLEQAAGAVAWYGGRDDEATDAPTIHVLSDNEVDRIETGSMSLTIQRVVERWGLRAANLEADDPLRQLVERWKRGQDGPLH